MRNIVGVMFSCFLKTLQKYITCNSSAGMSLPVNSNKISEGTCVITGHAAGSNIGIKHLTDTED